MGGGGGNDTVDGGDGNDSVDGGDGDDSVGGGAGDDSVGGGSGNDTVDGGDGNDTVDGGGGNDTVGGGAGDDTVEGGGGNDTLSGGDGTDTLSGGDGDDVLQFEADRTGQSGDSTDHVGSPGVDGTGDVADLDGLGLSDDEFDGGAGIDTLVGTAGGDAIILDGDHENGSENPTIRDVEVIDTGAGDDLVDLTSQTHEYGDVTVNAGTGDDTVWTGAGDDEINAGDGNDAIHDGAGDDVINAGAVSYTHLTLPTIYSV